MDDNNINSKFQKMADDMADFKASLKRIETALIGDEYHQGAIPELRERTTRSEVKIESQATQIDRIQRNSLNAEELAKVRQSLSFFSVWKLMLAGLIYLLPLIYFIYSLIGESK